MKTTNGNAQQQMLYIYICMYGMCRLCVPSRTRKDAHMWLTTTRARHEVMYTHLHKYSHTNAFVLWFCIVALRLESLFIRMKQEVIKHSCFLVYRQRIKHAVLGGKGRRELVGSPHMPLCMFVPCFRCYLIAETAHKNGLLLLLLLLNRILVKNQPSVFPEVEVGVLLLKANLWCGI